VKVSRKGQGDGELTEGIRDFPAHPGRIQRTWPPRGEHGAGSSVRNDREPTPAGLTPPDSSATSAPYKPPVRPSCQDGRFRTILGQLDVREITDAQDCAAPSVRKAPAIWVTHPLVATVQQSPSMTFALTLTPRALRLVHRVRATSLRVTVRWVPGSCTDDWCQPIPRLQVLEGEPEPEDKGWVRPVTEGVEVYISGKIAETAARSGDRLQIDASPLTRRFRLKGLTYALGPPTPRRP